MSGAIVVIPADTRQLDGYDWHASPVQYASAALKAAGVIPLIVPAFGSDGPDLVDTVLDRVDGVLISGARSNVDPALYGAPTSAEDGPYDPDRDTTSMALIRRSVERAIPLLAICRGIQELNVAFGGTLATEIQEQEGTSDHRRPESDDPDVRFGLQHSVNLEPDGCLKDILNAPSVLVNSLHRQAIGRIAPGLDIEARAEDGIIEAVSVSKAPAFALAVQWHPEYWAITDDTSQRLFKAFGDAVRAYAKVRGDRAPV
ncbi:MAG: gamma-glutamyl-gamma-aminobutyrate hydrolase family protein [Alphaproteobacteria bacterium]|nr:gamma-glutamyl-gamma-aminobutyrate hydrolase family protein [Alphaproteobacteria bacterium]